ncbi:methyltransferase family protein [Shewanella sairae]
MWTIAQLTLALTQVTGSDTSLTATNAYTANITIIRQIAIYGLLSLGMASAIAGVISFRQARTTVNPLKPESTSALVTSGMYKFSRNPMYLGMALALCAWAVYLASLCSMFGIVGFMLYMQRFQIAPEERALETIFGQEFIDYKKRVRPWV